MSETKCAACGAVGSGRVCGYCGLALTAPASQEDERAALDELHALLLSSDARKQCELLRHGFVPDSEAMLIEAGARCLPLLDPAVRKEARRRADAGEGKAEDLDPAEAAVARLEAICARLRIAGKGDEARLAAAEYATFVKLYRLRVRRDIVIGCALLALAGLVGLVVLLTVLW